MKKFLFVLLMLVCGFSTTSAVAKERIERMLVLLLDSSSSMSVYEWGLQKDGTADALEDESVMLALTGFGDETTAVMAIEWAGPTEQRIIAPWILVSSEADAHAIARSIRSHSRSFGNSPASGGSTAIGSALTFAMLHIELAPVTAERVIIDVSGDGKDSFPIEGHMLSVARAAAIERGYVINALPIVAEDSSMHAEGSELVAYFEAEVIGGYGAFMVPANGFKDYRRAIKTKIITEVAAR